MNLMLPPAAFVIQAEEKDSSPGPVFGNVL